MQDSEEVDYFPKYDEHDSEPEEEKDTTTQQPEDEDNDEDEVRTEHFLASTHLI